VSRVESRGLAYRWVSVFAFALVLMVVLVSAQARGVEGSYTNPVSKGVFDTFPDPSIIKGKDGYWYAYGTTDPVRQSFGDGSFRFLPMARSKDMIHWDYVGDVFTQSTFPEWLPGTPGVDSFLWAPDIRYIDGKYYLYYSGAHFGDDGLFSIGVATAPTPTGPWTDSGGQVIQGEDCPPTTNIDSSEFTDKDGTRYLYWGSYGAICAAKLPQ
jgi:arabinan endo-1,5-alpha-L-arabinosidase